MRTARIARRYRGGSLEMAPLGEIAIGDVLLVAPGDVLPVDGAVTSGIAVLDESALTGGALPVEHGAGDRVRSGTVNAGGPFDLRAATNAADSTYAGIIRLVSEAENSQAPFVRLADRYAAWFLPLVLPEAVTEQPGQGIAGTVQGRPVRLGRAGWAGLPATRRGSGPPVGGPGWTVP